MVFPWLSNSNHDFYYSNEDELLNANETSNTDSESIDDDSEIDEIDELFIEDRQYVEKNKNNHEYYLGICKLIIPDNYYLLLNTLSSKLFFKHDYDLIIDYLVEYSIIAVYNPNIEIMKLQISNDSTYTVIKKTYWIIIIQRHWKNVMKERNNIYKMRGTIPSLKYFEIHGRYPTGLNSMPVLYGMLSKYNNK